jgi:hypothetical protein
MEKPFSVCPKCSFRQWSRTDQKYLELNGQCWSCDRNDWASGELSTDEFERRESQSIKGEK